MERQPSDKPCAAVNCQPVLLLLHSNPDASRMRTVLPRKSLSTRIWKILGPFVLSLAHLESSLSLSLQCPMCIRLILSAGILGVFKGRGWIYHLSLRDGTEVELSIGRILRSAPPKWTELALSTAPSVCSLNSLISTIIICFFKVNLRR